jgi:transcriptional regulator with XRE-family HTH domain
MFMRIDVFMNQMAFIRQRVFGLSQADFASVAGVAQPTVSRWEDGTPPKISEMKRIRDEAIKRGLVWHDSFFFDSPPSAIIEERPAA